MIGTDGTTRQLDGGLKALSTAFRYVFRVLAAFIVVVLAWYFIFGGAFVVKQQERALVATFGKISPEVRGPGWHWAWPEPICWVIKVPATRMSLSTDSFWFFEDPSSSANSSKRYESSKLTPGKDGYLITGDANIVHTSWKMFYRVVEPYKYHMACYAAEQGEEPAKLLRNVFEAALIEVAASHSADFALKSPSFRKTVQEETARRVAALNIGVAVEDVVLEGRTPPMGAVLAFQAVLEAELKSSTEKHKANTYAIKTLNEAESASAAIVADANAYKTRVVASVKSDAKKFESIARKYRENPEVVPVALYSNTLSEVLNSAEDMFILHASDGEQEVRLLLNREPSENSSEKTKNSDGEIDD